MLEEECEHRLTKCNDGQAAAKGPVTLLAD